MRDDITDDDREERKEELRRHIATLHRAEFGEFVADLDEADRKLTREILINDLSKTVNRRRNRFPSLARSLASLRDNADPTGQNPRPWERIDAFEAWMGEDAERIEVRSPHEISRDSLNKHLGTEDPEEWAEHAPDDPHPNAEREDVGDETGTDTDGDRDVHIHVDGDVHIHTDNADAATDGDADGDDDE